MRGAVEELEQRGVAHEFEVRSAHRRPDAVAEYARSARERGLRVLICGAGLAAALPGVVAAHTDLPVIGVPLRSSKSVLDGLDALLAIVQMPPGVPVATVVVDNATNAAVIAPAAVGVLVAAKAQPLAPERVADIEARAHHDVAAFVDAVAADLGDAGRWFHRGLTSSDVVGTALALQVGDAGALILAGLEHAFAAVVTRAEEHRETLQIGRTHGIHAEPTTFGLKLAGWAFELDRDRLRLARAFEGMRVGKLSGAVGTCSAADPEVERVACERLGGRGPGRAGRAHATQSRVEPRPLL